MNILIKEPNAKIKKTFNSFSSEVIKTLKKKKELNYTEFSYKLKELGDVFIKNEEKDLMNSFSVRFAETLVGMKQYDLAGRVYSYLIKLNKGDSMTVESLATNALIIAKRQRDYVHVMARANDLKEIYKSIVPNTDKHLRALYDEKRALSAIVKEYEIIKNKKRNYKKQLKPKLNYEKKLAAIRFEIAKVLLSKKEYNAAKNELFEALEIYKSIGEGENSREIMKLIQELN